VLRKDPVRFGWMGEEAPQFVRYSKSIGSARKSDFRRNYREEIFVQAMGKVIYCLAG
jgi:hypothetical protein